MTKLHISLMKRFNLITRSRYSVARRLKRKWLFDKLNKLDMVILNFRVFEKSNLSSMKRLIKEKNLDIFFDIGANFGYYSVLLSGLDSINKVYAFEPVRRTFAQLNANLFLNNITAKVKAFNCALGSTEGEVDIWFDDKYMGLSSFYKGLYVNDAINYSHSEKVQCSIFDNLIDIKGQKALVKIDVEGFEQEVLKGMVNFLQNNQLVILVEVHKNFDVVESFLKTYGYKLLDEKAGDYVFSNF